MSSSQQRCRHSKIGVAARHVGSQIAVRGGGGGSSVLGLVPTYDGMPDGLSLVSYETQAIGHAQSARSPLPLRAAATRNGCDSILLFDSTQSQKVLVQLH